MVQALQAKTLSLAEVEEGLGLRKTDDPAFFPEWQNPLPFDVDLSLADQYHTRLAEIRTYFLYLDRYPIVEEVVKMVVLSPLLELAGAYRPPWRLRGEQSVEVGFEDGETLVRGRIDLLILQEHLWLATIESKPSRLAARSAVPQALSYMMAAQQPIEHPLYGLATNGAEFLWLKVVRSPTPVYGQSHLFSLEREGDFEAVLAIFRHLLREKLPVPAAP